MDIAKRIPMWIVLAVGAILLLPGVFMGLDLCDAGFYTVFYENIFSAPDTVEYNFMYYLSGIVGGIVCRIWPGGGLLCLRIVGALFVLMSVWMVLASYRDIVSRQASALATLCVVAAYASAPLTLSYDIVSLLLISGALTCLLKNDKWPVLAAGLLAGLALFARIPNVLFFMLILLQWWNKNTMSQKMVQSLLFIAGYGLAVGVVIWYMYLSGDLKIFLANMDTLVGVSADGEASHGLGGLIMAQVKYYLLLGRVAAKIAVMAAWCMLATRTRSALWRRLLYLPAGLYFCYLTIKTPSVLMLGGAILPALVVMSFHRYGGAATALARAAMLTALLLPCGSDNGGTNIGAILYLWGAPVALEGVLRLRLRVKGCEYKLSHKIIYGALVAFVCITVSQTLHGNLYFDNTPVAEMSGKIDNPKMRGILTSSERANVVNNLLPKLEKCVAPGDTLFAYGSIPLINYLTSTRPFVGCSWPEQLSAATLRTRFAEAKSKPVVCLQRFATIGSDWGHPSDEFIEGTEAATANIYHSADKWVVVRQFLENNGYQKVVGTGYFDIYLPPSKLLK